MLRSAPIGRHPTPAARHYRRLRSIALGLKHHRLSWSGRTGSRRRSEAVWDGSGVIVAILDTGIGPHPYLDPFLLPGYDFIDDDEDPSDLGDGIDSDEDGTVDEGAGHATHVAGIIHAVAPRATLLPVRVMHSEGQGSVFSIARGIYFAVDRGARVINLSLTLLAGSPSVGEALEYAASRGVIIVTSAGNAGRDEPVEFPSGEPIVISVAATDLEDQKASFSNYNAQVDLVAPGVSILSLYTLESAQFATWTGTSMSAPFVSGASALVIQAVPELPAVEVANTLYGTARNIDALNPGYIGMLGHGRLDIATLMTELPSPPPPVPAMDWGFLELAPHLGIFGPEIQPSGGGCILAHNLWKIARMAAQQREITAEYKEAA